MKQWKSSAYGTVTQCVQEFGYIYHFIHNPCLRSWESRVLASVKRNWNLYIFHCFISAPPFLYSIESVNCPYSYSCLMPNPDSWTLTWGFSVHLQHLTWSLYLFSRSGVWTRIMKEIMKILSNFCTPQRWREFHDSFVYKSFGFWVLAPLKRSRNLYVFNPVLWWWWREGGEGAIFSDVSGVIDHRYIIKKIQVSLYILYVYYFFFSVQLLGIAFYQFL